MTASIEPTGISLDTLRARARMLARIRDHFTREQVLEVDTPSLSAAATPSPALMSFRTDYHGHHTDQGVAQPLYLHTSPEFPMKRLLAAGSGSIYQIAKVYRDGEVGRYHNPEFQLLEWYRIGFGIDELIDDVDALVRQAIERPLGETVRLSYREAFRQYLALDPDRASRTQRLEALSRLDGQFSDSIRALDDDGLLDVLFTHGIEPRLPRECPVFIDHYPRSQAALAKVRCDADGVWVAERFELYINGIELANGFDELNDSAEQRRRFEAENDARLRAGLPVMPLDERFLSALPALPECAGVALGLDRLLMLATAQRSIDEVIAFTIDVA